jgi:hypothetical protein
LAAFDLALATLHLGRFLRLRPHVTRWGERIQQRLDQYNALLHRQRQQRFLNLFKR